MRVLTVLFLILLQGCASTDVVPQGPIFQYPNKPVNSGATAYFYQFDMPGVNACLLVGINGKYKGCVGYPGFAKVELQTGKHEVSFAPNSPIKIANLKFDFEFISGREYFFKYQPTKLKSSTDVEIETHYNMILGQSYGWYLIDKSHALTELSNLRAWHKAI